MTVPIANAGGAMLPDDAGETIERDPIDAQLRQSAAELEREHPRQDTWRPRYEADGEDGRSAAEENDLDRAIREAAGETKQREGLEACERDWRARPAAFSAVLAQRSAEAAADWWFRTDPDSAAACLAEAQGTGKYFGIDPAVHGPALVQSFARAQQYAELGRQVDAFRIAHRLTDSALRRMTEAINSGACEPTLQAALDHVMSRTKNPIEHENWLRDRRPGPVHLFSPGGGKPQGPRATRASDSNPWGFTDRPKKGF
jgi:hypothetical protein